MFHFELWNVSFKATSHLRNFPDSSTVKKTSSVGVGMGTVIIMNSKNILYESIKT